MNDTKESKPSDSSAKRGWNVQRIRLTKRVANTRRVLYLAPLRSSEGRIKLI
jgi:hypothetical protein